VILAVLTCTRVSGHDYATQTLERLDAQKWSGGKLLWTDGEQVTRDGWTCGATSPRMGPPNTYAFWDLLAGAEGQDVLFVEDDAIPSRGALEYIARMGCPPGLAYVSWFDPICRRSDRLPRIRYFDAGEIIPCQARAFPSATVARLLAFRWSPGWAPSGGSDANIATALAGQVAAVHQPSLFQHVGAASEVQPGIGLSGMRVSDSWMGEMFDVNEAFRNVSKSDLWRGY
jgi:hypothetical protein